jgi:hypothetical protein
MSCPFNRLGQVAVERLSRAALALYLGTTLHILIILYASIYLGLNSLLDGGAEQSLLQSRSGSTTCGPDACLGDRAVAQ